MKSFHFIFSLFSLCILSLSLNADDTVSERIDVAINILQKLTISETPIPQEILKESTGVAIIRMARGGFIIGGTHGKGIVLKNLGGGEWSAPAAFEMGGGSFGAQIGGDVVDYVYVLNNEVALGMFTSTDQVNFDAGASATAGPSHAAANKESLPGKSIYVYSTTDGAFAGATVGGSFIEIDDKANAAAYGDSVTTEEILSGKVSAPDSTAKLYALLDGKS